MEDKKPEIESEDKQIDQKQEELTNSKLREQAVELGFPKDEIDQILKKSSLIAIINTLKAKSVVQKVDSAEPTAVNPTEERKTDANWKSKAQRQWEYWDSCPKIKIMVPLAPKEKQGIIKWIYNEGMKREIPHLVSGAIQPVTENGAQYLIPKGVYIDVPEPVAKIIEQKFQQTSEAGANLLIDRIDPETGKSVADQL